MVAIAKKLTQNFIKIAKEKDMEELRNIRSSLTEQTSD